MYVKMTLIEDYGNDNNLLNIINIYHLEKQEKSDIVTCLNSNKPEWLIA